MFLPVGNHQSVRMHRSSVFYRRIVTLVSSHGCAGKLGTEKTCLFFFTQEGKDKTIAGRNRKVISVGSDSGRAAKRDPAARPSCRAFNPTLITVLIR